MFDFIWKRDDKLEYFFVEGLVEKSLDNISQAGNIAFRKEVKELIEISVRANEFLFEKGMKIYFGRIFKRIFCFRAECSHSKNTKICIK